MAHSDVVPAETSPYAKWTYPPFSGHYDGEFIWGRGSEDDKSNLIAILSAIDCLISHGFSPLRTVIISIGFDEEGGAEQSYGARCLAELLLARYGHDGIEMIFDEGVAVIQIHFGTEFALPATAEKGYVDVSVTVNVPGGHSSTPPDHTASKFGLLAQVIAIIEDHPFAPYISRRNPTLTYLQRAARFSKSMPDELRKAILDDKSSEELLKYLEASRDRRALVRTTTAADLISGGDKVNSLPETANVVINHRIAVEDSVRTVKDHYINLLQPWAKNRRCQFEAFGLSVSERPIPPVSMIEANNNDDDHTGKLTLSAHYELEASPVTSADDVHFEWISTTLSRVFGPDLIVAPVLLSGNTDTRYYWGLSKHIYRMSPWRASHDPRGSRMHTVDERMPVKGLLEMVRFYYELICVVDEKRA
ncbi:hypothetical protein PV10_07522 [Exophiala mesophila]|uniref:Peptidase M20 dimerisation domain-containing protein n=1 Tax=Exophiala mesophila TaxID=212818 RepID=A0A0D1XQ05_EXOME|nr:uncharacterized protein PV10_07522 [Exophiala mesophila]KIV90191.1 hypothetical protein PV10_07522 [Exophiala mesophila]